jgi:proline iminopeptidase
MSADPSVDPFAAGRWLERPAAEGVSHRVWYCEGGDPAGRPVLVIHGGPGGRSRVESVAGFAGLPLRWIAVDQRGCGRSLPLGELRGNTLEWLLDDLEALRAHLGLEGWAVAAGSWGAFVALAYAARHPQRVQGLFLRSAFLGSAAELAHYLGGWAPWLGEPGRRWLDGESGESGEGPAPSTPLDLADLYLHHRHDLAGLSPAGQPATSAQDRLALAAQAYDDDQGAPGGVLASGARWSLARMQRPEARSEATLASWRVHAHYGGSGWTAGHDAWGWAAMVLPALAVRGLPLMLVHGEADAVCPVATTDRLAAMSARGGLGSAGPCGPGVGMGVEVSRVPGGGHRMGSEPMAGALREAAQLWGRRLLA